MKDEKYIPLEECENGALYRIEARNFWLGVFNKETQGFVGVRHKFGQVYLFEEYHWDCPQFATVRPIEKLEVCPVNPVTEANAELFEWMQRKVEQYPQPAL